MTIKMNSHLASVTKWTPMKRAFLCNESDTIVEHHSEVIEESEDDSDLHSDEEDLKEVIELDDESDDN